MKEYQVYTPTHVANFFLAQPDHTIDNLKLNKLVYIAYGFCLALLEGKDEEGKPEPRKIFDEAIQAWKFGPVIPSIYHEFKTFGFKRIDTLSVIYDYTDSIKNEVPQIDDNDKEVLDLLSEVYDEYGDTSSFDLVDLTHQKDTPWEQIYKDNAYHLQIPDEIIREYYQKLSKGELN